MTIKILWITIIVYIIYVGTGLAQIGTIHTDAVIAVKAVYKSC